MFELSLGDNHQAHVLALHEGIDIGDRRAEVGNIQPTLQLSGYAGVEEVNNDLAGLFADVDTDTGIGQTDNDLAITLWPAAEIDTLEAMLTGAHCTGEARGLGRLRAGNPAHRIIHRDGIAAIVRRAGVGGWFHQVQNHARAILPLDGVNAGNGAHANLDAGLGHADPCVREIKRDARRITGCKHGGLGGHPGHAQLDLDAVARKLCIHDIFDCILRLCSDGGWRGHRTGRNSHSNRFDWRCWRDNGRCFRLLDRCLWCFCLRCFRTTNLRGHAIAITCGLYIELARFGQKKINVDAGARIGEVGIDAFYGATTLNIRHVAQHRVGKAQAQALSTVKRLNFICRRTTHPHLQAGGSGVFFPRQRG